MVPGPVKAVVLLFPIDADGEEKRKREDARIATDGQPMLDKTIFWVKQTVSCVWDRAIECLFSLDTKCMRDYRTYTCTRKCA